MTRIGPIAAILCLVGSVAFADDSAASCAGAAEPTQCLADKSDALPDFDKIRTPDSPAFTLLGISPSKIDRPTTPKQLTVALGGFLADGGIAIPKSLAIELWPYWLVSHPEVDASAYQARDRLTQLLQNVTFSLGTSTLTRGAMTGSATTVLPTDTTLAIGARTFVDITASPVIECAAELKAFEDPANATAASTDAEGKRLSALVVISAKAMTAAEHASNHANADVTEDQQQLERDREAASKAAPHAFDAILAADALKLLGDQAAAGKAHDLLKAATTELAAANARLVDHRNARAQGATAQLQALCTGSAREAKQGLVLELAIAASELFLDGKESDHHFADGAAWGTLAYESLGWSAVAVARGLSTRVLGSDRTKFFETGIRVIRSRDAYAFSLELMMRAPDTTYRVAAAVDYHLQDSTWLTFSFGRDFASGDAGSLFSLANVKFGIGDPKVLPAVKK